MLFSEIYNLGNSDPHEGERRQSIPSTTPIFVSLFLILLAFFVGLTKDLDLKSENSEKALRSIHQEFGKPENDPINFGGYLKPKVDSFTLQLEQLFGANAQIEGTLDGQEISITAKKDFFYYEDELNFKPERKKLLLELQELLLQWHDSEQPKFKIMLGLSDFKLDEKRLDNFRRRLPRLEMDIGLNPADKNEFKMVVSYE